MVVRLVEGGIGISMKGTQTCEGVKPSGVRYVAFPACFVAVYLPYPWLSVWFAREMLT